MSLRWVYEVGSLDVNEIIAGSWQYSWQYLTEPVKLTNFICKSMIACKPTKIAGRVTNLVDTAN